MDRHYRRRRVRPESHVRAYRSTMLPFMVAHAGSWLASAWLAMVWLIGAEPVSAEEGPIEARVPPPLTNVRA